MKVYIAFGAADDLVLATQLRAVASSDNRTVFVPSIETRESDTADLEEQSMATLSESDLVIGLIGTGVSNACRQEISLGNELGKLTVVIAEPALAAQLKHHYAGNVVIVNPADPARAELGIVNFLKKVDISPERKKTVVALGTVALGLVLLTREPQSAEGEAISPEPQQSLL